MCTVPAVRLAVESPSSLPSAPLRCAAVYLQLLHSCQHWPSVLQPWSRLAPQSPHRHPGGAQQGARHHNSGSSHRGLQAADMDVIDMLV